MLNLISYRGPETTGHLNGCLTQGWKQFAQADDLWWHMDKSYLRIMTGTWSQVGDSPHLGKNLQDGHDRYCQDFLWPIMHDSEEYATYCSEDKLAFERFNRVFCWQLARLSQKNVGTFFIQNYQFAMLPKYLKEYGKTRVTVFWHIPWPASIPEYYAQPIADIARGLLDASALGFQNTEYALNFMQFVDRYLPEFECNLQEMSITRTDGRSVAMPASRKLNQNSTGAESNDTQATRIVTVPLGVDFDYWSSLAQEQERSIWRPFVSGMPFILSVDNGDYTQGVANRLDAINRFFERYPEWHERIVFMQVQDGLHPSTPILDKYWNRCQEFSSSITGLWSNNKWTPLVSTNNALTWAELALLYRQAAVMLVNPIKDGMSLEAKEFIACQGNHPGVLALSQGAGAWKELGDCAIAVYPGEPERMAVAINAALSLSAGEKALRMLLLKERVHNGGLARWWHYSTKMLENAPIARNIA